MSIASAIATKQQQIADSYTAVSNKGGTLPATQNLTNLATAISSIPSGTTPVITSLNVTPTTSTQTITAPSGTDGYSPVNVSAVTASIDANITAGNIKKDVVILGVTGSYEGSGGGGGSGTRDVTLTRVSDDNGNEIGTWFMNFADANGNEYKVVILDAQYRLASAQWCSKGSTVTDMPLYSNNYSAWWYNNAKETATTNTQLILDFCTAGGYTSEACSHCRSKSFTINGTTYYGQLPNMREVFDMWRHRAGIESMDTSASTSTSTNFSSGRRIWSSSQYNSANGWNLNTSGNVGNVSKTGTYFACPVLEIPA